MITHISPEYTGISLKAQVAKFIPPEDKNIEYIDINDSQEELDNFEIFDKDYVLTTCRSDDLGYCDILLYEQDELLHHYTIELDLLPLQSQILKINDVYYVVICGFHNQIEFYQLNVLDQMYPTYSYEIKGVQQILTVIQNPQAKHILCASSDDLKIHFIETVNMREVLTLDSHHLVQKIIFSEKNKNHFYTIGVESSKIYFYDFSIKTTDFIKEFEIQHQIEDFIQIEDNKLLISCSDGILLVFNVETEKIEAQYQNNSSYLCLIQNKKLIFASSPESNKIDIFNTQLEKIKEIPAQNVFSFQKHEQMLICGCGQNRIMSKNILRYITKEEAQKYLDINSESYNQLSKQKEIQKGVEEYQDEESDDQK